MGFGSHGEKMTYAATLLSRPDAIVVGSNMMLERPVSGSVVGHPIIAVDCNNVINVVGKNAVNPVAAVAALLVTWALHGAVMIPICDGRRRPKAKQASNKNRASREKNKSKAIIGRQDLRDVINQLEHERLDAKGRAKLVKKREKLEGSVKRAETQSINIVPPNFPELLEEELQNKLAHTTNTSGGRVTDVRTTEFQADPHIIQLLLKGKCQLAMTNDVDIIAFSSDDCPIITKFTGGKITIKSTSKATIQKCKSWLPEKSQSIVKFDWEEPKPKPKHPVFEGIEDRNLRALIGVIIGCDVSPGGVTGLGPEKVMKKLKEIKENENESEQSVYDQLVQYAVEESKPSQTKPPKYERDVLDTLVKGILYEPTNLAATDDERNDAPPIYMGNVAPPLSLPRYLEEFATEGTTTIEEGPEILRCKGPLSNGSGSHDFLAAEDHYSCSYCNETVCHFCKEDMNKKQYCLACYIVEKLLPGVGVGDLKTITEMRDELKNKYNFDNVDQLSIDEVEDAWASHSLHRTIEDLVDNVPFPIFPASAIESGEKWETLAEVNFALGGSFLMDPDIDEKHIPDVLELFALLVYFDNSKKYTKWKKDGAVYEAMPKIFIDFAGKCRVDSGYRMLKRILRHAMDSRMERALDKEIAKLILYNGKVGIHLKIPVPASMKSDIYDGETVLTADELLCALCGCKSGAQKEQRVACIHTLVRAFVLSLLIAEDLAENMLLDLTDMITSAATERDVWDLDSIESMKKSILILMGASGEATIAEEASKCNTLYDMLQAYKTGTQRSKQSNRPHAPPTKDEMGPIWKVIKDSPAQQVKEIFHRSEPKPNIDPTEEAVVFVPDYVQTDIVLSAAGIDTTKFSPVAWKLLELRRNKQASDGNIDPSKLLVAKQEYKSLVEEAKKRSTRLSAKQLANLKLPAANKSKSASEKRKPYPTRANSQRKKKKSGRGGANYCVKDGCNNPVRGVGIISHRLPPIPPKPPADASLAKHLTWRGKDYLRQEACDRCGLSRTDTMAELRICDDHPTETETERLDITYKGRKYYADYQLTYICGEGKKSSLNPSEESKGVGRDRLVRNPLIQLQKEAKKASLPNDGTMERRLEIAEGKAAESQLLVQQMAEQLFNDSQQPSVPICPGVAKAAGIVASKEYPENAHPRQKVLFKVKRMTDPGSTTEQPSVSNKKRKTDDGTSETTSPCNKKHRMNVDLPPLVDFNTKDSEVQRRTGFKTLSQMIACVIVLCNGDFDRIRKRKTPLTWLEEWFIFLEWIYHQSLRRQWDFESTWGLDHHYLNDVKDCKAALTKAALLSWPRFPKYEEDVALRDPVKWVNYKGCRVIMHDTSDIKTPQYTDPSSQRATWSEYYGQNCAKGGIFLFPCGWGGTWDLWGGHISDSDYHRYSLYLNFQKKFQETDLVDGSEIQFTNVLDRGYRGKMAAWKAGRQMSLQPPASKSDRRFTGRQTLFAGKVASDRSGNERSVKVSKRSGLMDEGLKTGMSAKRFNDAWLNWAFISNFMYDSVV